MQNFDLQRLMSLDSYPRLLSTLQAAKQRQVALALVQNLVAGSGPVADATQVRLLLQFLQPLVDAGSAGFDVVRVCAVSGLLVGDVQCLGHACCAWEERGSLCVPRCSRGRMLPAPSMLMLSIVPRTLCFADQAHCCGSMSRSLQGYD